MELVYAWVEKFRNYKEVELNFSERFIINYDHSKKSINIVANAAYISIYPEYITNINAVVGKNSVGKTNLLDAIGLKSNDRNKNNAEFEKRYKQKRKFGYIVNDDIEAEIKHSIYFFLYYMGKDSNNQDLFCIEGNDIESFQSMIKNESGISNGYWKSKYWFAFTCYYSEGMLIHQSDLNEQSRDYKIDINEESEGLYNDTRSEQDKIAIISLREKLNPKYYDYSSTKPEDDYKISVPRRVAKFQSKLLVMKIEMLHKQLHRSKKFMFRDDRYTLKINYNTYFLINGFEDKNRLGIPYSYKKLEGREKEVCKVLESFVQYFFNTINSSLNNEAKKNIEMKINLFNIKRKSLKGYRDYYVNIINVITDNYFDDEEDKQHVLKCFTDFADELSINKRVKFYKDYISLDITKKNNLDEILKVIEVTVDERVRSNFNEILSVFGDFFDYSIENLSDGELAYLGFYASLYEQVALLTPYKDKYIILLDEPEARMHPELTRNFMNELILFLADVGEGKKKFQIITSTHSPFILSDIATSNIIYLEKDKNGYCRNVNRGLNTFGTNIHTLLKDGFFMASTMGEFATNKIREVISGINTCNLKAVTLEQKNEWLYIINSIGEPLIQNRLMKMYNDKFQLNYTDLYNENLRLRKKLKKYEEPRKINETIDVLKSQVEQLRTYINELEDKNE
ncbi:hypothetical protein CN273_29895 [Bacillus thuringiensis]|uniref:AAA family ATPase n=1 Tax=Bacillus thuringiensis TaxID=1428 RepID=UPI000BF5D847|nr:AAA family ATPase [Bacillus thuringiensis]PFB75354.1 hypothetical protein CN273_29895 [Bacillus thuringiensis]